MLSLPPHTAPVLYRSGLFSKDPMHCHCFWGFACREEEHVYLADVIMPFRKVVTALCHSVWAKGCTYVQACKIRQTGDRSFITSQKREGK